MIPPSNPSSPNLLALNCEELATLWQPLTVANDFTIILRLVLRLLPTSSLRTLENIATAAGNETTVALVDGTETSLAS